MFDIVLLMLRGSYCYSRFLGVLNFEINTRTGEAKITWRATIYAAVVNAVICCLLPLLSRSELIHLLWKYAGALHEYIFLVVMVLRIICVLATFYSRWWQRRRIIRLVFGLRRLALRRPHVIRMWRWGVIRKFTSICVTELIQMSTTILGLRNFLTLNLIVSIMVLYMVAALVNVIISHFYFAMLNIHLHYVLLKEELLIILHEMRSLEHEERKATFMSKCCDLADRLEDIASRQSELQLLSKNIVKIFGLQGICISTTSYVSSIGCIYFTYSALQRHGMNWSPLLFLILLFEIGTYFVDIIITVCNIYSVLDDHAELVQLLEAYTSFTPRLDRRLQLVMESFQLQLKRDPFVFNLLGIYKMNKTQAMTMANSVVTSSIVLIQYELKNAIEINYTKFQRH